MLTEKILVQNRGLAFYYPRRPPPPPPPPPGLVKDQFFSDFFWYDPSADYGLKTRQVASCLWLRRGILFMKTVMRGLSMHIWVFIKKDYLSTIKILQIHAVDSTGPPDTQALQTHGSTRHTDGGTLVGGVSSMSFTIPILMQGGVGGSIIRRKKKNSFLSRGGGGGSILLYPISLLIECWDLVQGGNPLCAAVKCLSDRWGQI